jgi:hypothetical protein
MSNLLLFSYFLLCFVIPISPYLLPSLPLFFLSSQTADTCELLCIIIQYLDYVLERRCGFSMDMSQSLVPQGGWCNDEKTCFFVPPIDLILALDCGSWVVVLSSVWTCDLFFSFFFSPFYIVVLFSHLFFPILAFWLACMFNVQKGRECFSLVMSVNVLVWWTLIPLVFGLVNS